MTLLVAVAAIVATGCAGSDGQPAVATATTPPITQPTPRIPDISGGTRGQRALLRQIVGALRPTQIRGLRVEPASRRWAPLEPGDVALVGAAEPAPRGRDDLVGLWEIQLVGGAFRDRSAAMGLPRVAVVGNGKITHRATGGRRLPAAHGRLSAFRRLVLRAARTPGGRIVAVRVGAPDGYAAAVALVVDHPAAFLTHGMRTLDARLQRIRADGMLLELYERNGRLLDVSSWATRLSTGSGWVADRFQGCVPVLRGVTTLSAPACPAQ